MNNIKNRLEELLPDYAFGRINEKDKSFFEENIKDFPELMDELEQIQRVFQKVESVDFDGLMKKNSRNVSVKVMRNIKKSRPSLFLQFLQPKNLLPTLGLVVMAYITFFVGFDNPYYRPSSRAVNEIQVFGEMDLVALSNEIDIDQLFIRESDLISFAESSVDDDVLSDFEFSLSTENYYDGVESYIGSSQYLPLEKLIDELSEDEFQEIIKDMYDENYQI